MNASEEAKAPAAANSTARAAERKRETAPSVTRNGSGVQFDSTKSEALARLGCYWRAAQNYEPWPDGSNPIEFGDWQEFGDAILDAYRRAGIDGAHEVVKALAKDRPDLAELFKERRTVTLADLADILPATSWLWPSWLPIGYVSLIVGASGVGKTWLALRFAASVLSGQPWPDGTPYEHAGLIVWCDTEASQALLLERATGWKLPTHKILLPTIDDDPVSDVLLDDPEGWAELLRLVEEHKPPLVIVDSLSGAHRGDENSAELRDLLSKLAALARDRQIAVLATHHLRKANPFEELSDVTLDRIRGTTAIPQYARLIMAIDRPDAIYEPDRVRLKVIKSNLARFPEPIGFEIDVAGLTFGKAPTAPREETQLDKAIDLLMTLLTHEPMAANEIYEEGEGAGVSKRTIQRAKEKLNLPSFRKENRWFWSLPAREGDGNEPVQ